MYKHTRHFFTLDHPILHLISRFINLCSLFLLSCSTLFLNTHILVTASRDKGCHFFKEIKFELTICSDSFECNSCSLFWTLRNRARRIHYWSQIDLAWPAQTSRLNRVLLGCSVWLKTFLIFNLHHFPCLFLFPSCFLPQYAIKFHQAKSGLIMFSSCEVHPLPLLSNKLTLCFTRSVNRGTVNLRNAPAGVQGMACRTYIQYSELLIWTDNYRLNLFSLHIYYTVALQGMHQCIKY